MIKTIISANVEELDKAVNEFMSEKGQNLPVRTESYVITGGATAVTYHKATIFFDYRFNNVNGTVPEEEVKEQKKERIGALWVQKDATISGVINDKKTVMTPELVSVINAIQEKTELTLFGKEVVVYRNKFKKTDKHPDFVIYGA